MSHNFHYQSFFIRSKLKHQIQNLQELNENLDNTRMRAEELNLDLTLQLKSNSAGLLGMIKRLFLGDSKVVSL